MSSIGLVLGDGDAFDKCIDEGLPEGCDLSIVTKDVATEGGNPAACITFTVETQDGSVQRAQAVVTVKNLINALHAVMGRYSHLANAAEPDVKDGEVIRGMWNSVSYDAVGMKEIWLITFEGMPGAVGIAKTKDGVAAVAKGIIEGN